MNLNLFEKIIFWISKVKWYNYNEKYKIIKLDKVS